MGESKLPQIEGKVLYLQYGSDYRNRAYIEEPSMEIQAGRLFLTGTPLYFHSKEPATERFCIAWDSVNGYFIFDSVEHCEECRNNWRSIKSKTRGERNRWRRFW
jgi:hypothetical protein